MKLPIAYVIANFGLDDPVPEIPPELVGQGSLGELRQRPLSGRVPY